jgi:hypothetical protein
MDLSILEKIVIGIATVALVLFVTFRIMSVLRNQTDNTAATNTAMDTLITAIGTIPTWVSVTIVVAVGGFLIMYLRKGFGSGSSGGY